MEMDCATDSFVDRHRFQVSLVYVDDDHRFSSRTTS